MKEPRMIALEFAYWSGLKPIHREEILMLLAALAGDINLKAPA